ncbi:VOC family protein [Aureimonas populi]|uniref:VOC family protein n=1 Tax=Aureimonas populi TaxID=1701758 RepID=A0ABW5CNU7_9HYPH|nr:VOC family protein [Aureimonas populi]
MMTAPRKLDHCVLAVPSLEEARGWFEALGFVVAPDAQHPFGTENACVFLADGSYIEPLAVGHRETCEAEARAGNAFITRDQAHRFRIGTPSFSCVAFASPDADADRDDMREAGFGGGESLAFERRFRTPDGQDGLVGFKLAFARDLRAPDVAFFTCQPTHVHKPDRSALTRHANGALGTARLVMAEPNPTDFQYYLQHLTGDREIEADSFGMTLRMGRSILEVATPEALAIRYGAARDERRGLSFEGIVLAVRDFEAVRSFAPQAEERHGRLIVRLGAGAFVGFEKESA